MRMKAPFTDLEINTQDAGFYEGHSLPIALISKATMVGLVLWAIIWPINATATLDGWNWATLLGFNTFYIISVGFFAFFLFALAVLPTGKRKLGGADTQPEFSTFSWFAMMFGAGLGVGLMVFATAEPIGLWGSNPIIVAQGAEPNSPDAVQSAFRYTFLHFGFHAWAIYVVTGLSLAYYAYTRDMPLTIRTALTPVLGRFANGFVGHIVDVLGVVATILGVAVTIGYGVSQFVDGVYNVTGMEWLMAASVDGAAPLPSTVGLITALCIIMGMSILSAVSGVGRGIKYLSNLNLVLSLLLLLTFVVFGSFLFSMTTYATALADYIWHFIPLSFEAYGPLSETGFEAALPAEAQAAAGGLYSGATNAWGSFDGFVSRLEGPAASLDTSLHAAAYDAGTQGRLFGWQAGWTTFYWAWWIAFSPFVGLFLARISRGRTVREFIFGCVVAPALVCFAWMTILGGTAVEAELSGAAEGAIIAASNTNKLFVSLQMILPEWLVGAVIIMCVVLIMTFLVTSADSGILVMNTIMSGGATETGIKHRIIWGLILTGVIGSLLVAGALDPDNADPLAPLQDAMIVGALPFTMVMVIMAFALMKALFNDSRREKSGFVVAEPAE
ncbi:BCCT family transporter [Cognatiyoonia sp. IB215182]|uniref:BCCT family transporter n=1 Tax=Cognatiyoonia sp. IB215182 TaxID=3097353 RepID=UPI002A14C865|nr:BCCT family transporter [Cognatiyoonia sp. IB215182]MDX8354520.1 BCCT family transporter [Cognatiyoonia sp. IB215182]